MTRSVRAHTDKSWLSDNGVMVGPFAVSIGVSGDRRMQSVRVPRRLTWGEMADEKNQTLLKKALAQQN